MTTNEKVMTLIVSGLGGVVLWLWIRKNPQAVTYINNVAGNLGLPQLIPPAVIDSAGNIYNIGDLGGYSSAGFPTIPTYDSSSNSCCPKCDRGSLSTPVSPPSPAPQQSPTVQEIEHIIYQTVYLPPPQPKNYSGAWLQAT